MLHLHITLNNMEGAPIRSTVEKTKCILRTKCMWDWLHVLKKFREKLFHLPGVGWERFTKDNNTGQCLHSASHFPGMGSMPILYVSKLRHRCVEQLA